MGRFDTLKSETQDMVLALLPAIAASFGMHEEDFKYIIPEDIRMRKWDCERRDHIKDQPEDDPRNWGVEFLKSIGAIARLNGGNIAEFHNRLREKTDKHTEKHPWARLEDIRQVKNEYLNPHLRNPTLPQPESSSDDSLDLELEELHELSLPRGMRGKNHEAYETRIQGWDNPKKKKPVRLRRDPELGWDRRGKRKSQPHEESPLFVNADYDSSGPRDDSPPKKDKKRRRLTQKRTVIKKEEEEDEEDFSTIISSGDEDEASIKEKRELAQLKLAQAQLEVDRKMQKYYEAKEQRIATKKARQAGREPSASSAGVPIRDETRWYDPYADVLAGLNGNDTSHRSESIQNQIAGYGYSGLQGLGSNGNAHSSEPVQRKTTDYRVFKGFGDDDNSRGSDSIQNDIAGYGFSGFGGLGSKGNPRGSEPVPNKTTDYRVQSSNSSSYSYDLEALNNLDYSFHPAPASTPAQDANAGYGGYIGYNDHNDARGIHKAHAVAEASSGIQGTLQDFAGSSGFRHSSQNARNDSSREPGHQGPQTPQGLQTPQSLSVPEENIEPEPEYHRSTPQPPRKNLPFDVSNSEGEEE